MASEQRIDDRDSSVSYSKPILGSEWSKFGGPKEYMGTASLTRTKGANAKITFSGTSIAVYDTVLATSVDFGTTSQSRADGNVGTEYTTNPTTEAQYGVEFFQSSSLSPSQYTLEAVNEPRNGWFWLDYFIVAGPDSTTASMTSASTSASSTLSATSTPSTPSSHSATSSCFTISTPLAPTGVVDDASKTTPTSTPSSLTDSNTSRSSGPPAGVIVGAIFGGMFGLVLLLTLIWLVHRKLANRYADAASAIPMDAPIPSPSSKVAQGLASTHKPQDSRVVSSYEIPSTPGAMAQMHQHTRYGSSTSNPNVYPFSPAVQHTYHQNVVGQRGPAPSPYMEVQQHNQQQHGHPPSKTSTGVNSGYSPHLQSVGANEQTGYGYGGQAGVSSYHGSCGSDASLPSLYPGLPPGLSGPRTR
ncbi:hypothetical protein AN958_02109 [Leucoagaricus sp. SymC.cos]|nr:hypothetical protein AN958_02109 [Leucoagaricus sp. SymC.cos]